MFKIFNPVKHINPLLKKGKSLFCTTPPKFVPKNNAGKIIGGSLFGTVLLSYGAYKYFSDANEQYYSEEELRQKGVFVEDQKILNDNKKVLDAKLSLQVKEWELESATKEKLTNKMFNERYYFLLLGHNDSMIKASQNILDEVRSLVKAKYYLSPELGSYQQDIAQPVLMSVDTNVAQLSNSEGVLILQGNQQIINKSFGQLLNKDYQSRLFLVDGINGSTVSLNIRNENSTNLAAIFILNYLNEASVFRRFLI